MLELATLAIFVLAAWFWVDSMRAREAALDAGRRACAAEGVQFLDWTVAMKAMRLARDAEGRLRVRRLYEFEFSDTGDNRLKGSIMLIGAEPVAIHMASREPSPHGVTRLH
ncbi:MAG TPA: DUF3301 domain-containing protein [Burkholderiales bacterium]|jgi:hypothetical protein|nr:DUF3301 domain-containing protein [Burkholderiales bacterium]